MVRRKGEAQAEQGSQFPFSDFPRKVVFGPVNHDSRGWRTPAVGHPAINCRVAAGTGVHLSRKLYPMNRMVQYDKGQGLKILNMVLQ
jgi:hypothetical protein